MASPLEVSEEVIFRGAQRLPGTPDMFFERLPQDRKAIRGPGARKSISGVTSCACKLRHVCPESFRHVVHLAFGIVAFFDGDGALEAFP